MKAVNPRTGKADYDFDATPPEEVAATARALRIRQPEWEARGPDGRAEVLRAFAAEVDRRADAITQALDLDTGRTAIARMEVETLQRTLHRWAARAPQLLDGLPRNPAPSLTPAITITPRWSAYPLFGAIAPWNFPVILSHIDAVPALAAGCAALVKPSEVTPRFCAPLREALNAVPSLPLAYVLGGPETGQALVEQVDYICFTGSTATGRKVAQAAARRLIPANLELGGKDALIVTASADPLAAARIALRASVVATGQACQSIERIYVARQIEDGFLAALVQLAEQTLLAPEGGPLGPFIFPPQAAKVQAQIDEAIARGAQVLTGGKVVQLGGGAYLRPTVITGVSPDMAVMREETFGPVLPVTAYADVDQAIALANAGEYGLAAAVIAGDAEEAARIGERLDAGAVSLMDAGLTTYVGDAANHSRRASGLGPSRMGDEGLLRFMRRQALIRQDGAALPLAAYSQ
ncbi:aldehyde dehydrogenase family protein [Porphyrobacter sp. GA68]|uniref:aldehyde dehydrogenase family protein n=1 Tax=Porphyrobacter sp. GA68 TaxID=2883480 RepID=UPI001D190D5A|nr:aldehyde dehydrogenase family protein [Porphyrobacter sp. GA68]